MMELETFYFLCIGFGFIYALFTLLFGDSFGDSILGQIHIPVLQPVSLVSGTAAFGGSGVILTYATTLTPWYVFGLSVLAGIGVSLASYFIWIEPMKEAETSTGFSIYHLIGRMGEVITTIPADGVGEIIVTMVNGRINQMAASLEGKPIPEGSKVVVVEIRERVLYVTPFETEENE